MDKKDFAILYVDDEVQNLISFKATFRREYNIHTAVSGDEGIEIIRNNNIHLIITDQRMPGMTGVQFLETILPEYPDPVRMILTGFSDVEVIIQAINSGRVFRYITKPWDENELRMSIENARQFYSLQSKNRSLVNELQQKIEEQEQTLHLFMKYVPESVIQKSLDNKGSSILEGESREIATLFCDIRGFTPLSEELEPKEVVKFLNDYYRILSAPIKSHKGIVNQFVGDEIFATFGVPEFTADNEVNAVFCALEMRKALGKLNEIYAEKLQRDIYIGIGINFGEVIAGNLGSEDQLSYSVVGDTVNTGKRIEMLTKEIPNCILICHNVFEKVKDFIETKPWEPVQVKGKKDKILVYEVLSRK